MHLNIEIINILISRNEMIFKNITKSSRSNELKRHMCDEILNVTAEMFQ